MAVDMFIKIGDIKGEAQDEKHKEEIDILSWSWGMSQSGTTHVGSGGGAGKASFNDLSFTKWVDQASAPLMLHCANGKHIKEATLTVRKAGDKPLEYIVIQLKDIIIASVSTGGSGGANRLTESVSLNFAEVEYKYTVQKKDGTAGAQFPFGWKIAENVPK